MAPKRIQVAVFFQLILLYITVGSSESVYQEEEKKIQECWPENSVCSKAEGSLVKCPLKWVNADFGDLAPDNSIPAAMYGKDNFVARAKMGDDIYVIGRLENGKVYTAYKDSALVNTTYQILTNIHGCILNWGKGFGLSNTVPAYEGAATIVARAIFEDILLIGQADGNQVQVNQDDKVKYSPEFEVLQSYSKGLRLDLKNFKFAQDVRSPSNDILGIDQIVNKADTEVRQSVYHFKRVFESTHISNLNTWGLTGSFDFHMKIPVPIPTTNETIDVTVDLDGDFDMEGGGTTKIYEEKETIIESRREIIVPPFSDIQVCTIVGSLDDFNYEYVAEGEYSSPGLTSNEVLGILRRDNLTGYPSGDSIIVKVEGGFSGTLVTTTQFIAAPIDSPTGCSILSTKMMQLKTDKTFGRISWDEAETQKSEIEDMIQENIQYRPVSHFGETFNN